MKIYVNRGIVIPNIVMNINILFVSIIRRGKRDYFRRIHSKVSHPESRRRQISVTFRLVVSFFTVCPVGPDRSLQGWVLLRLRLTQQTPTLDYFGLIYKNI